MWNVTCIGESEVEPVALQVAELAEGITADGHTGASESAGRIVGSALLYRE